MRYGCGALPDSMASLRRHGWNACKACGYLKQAFILFLAAVALNYPWELAQAPLYAGMESWAAVRWHCFVAALGDGILIWMIFATGWAVFRRVDWYMRPGMQTVTLMLAAGLGIGISVEWTAVNMLGRWQYTARMPLFPGLGVGLVPLLQMVLLPPGIFRMTAWWLGSRPVGDSNGVLLFPAMDGAKHAAASRPTSKRIETG